MSGLAISTVMATSTLVREVGSYFPPICCSNTFAAAGIERGAVMERLREEGFEFPVIILTGFGDVPTATLAMKMGAADFLEKPHNVEALTRAQGAD